LSPIFDMSDNTVGAAGIAEAVEALQEGDLVGLPTETVYGLAADAGNGKAVARIFAAKGRPHFNPLIVHVLSLAEAEKVAVFDGAARRLAEAFWPGALTLVLPKRPEAGIAELTTAGLDTIAIRVPAHPIARIVLSAFAGPIAAPSANRSGHVSPTTAAHVAEDLGGAVACILDAGPTGIGLESTIVGFPKGRATLLRPGGIARTDIERVLGSELAMAEEGTAVSAPGMLASHYAPAASLRLNAADVRPGEALLAFGSRLPAISLRLQPIFSRRSGRSTGRRRRLPSCRSPMTVSARRSTTASSAPLHQKPRAMSGKVETGFPSDIAKNQGI
jgi:L-threonylcarbamoyladenylate synthase